MTFKKGFIETLLEINRNEQEYTDYTLDLNSLTMSYFTISLVFIFVAESKRYLKYYQRIDQYFCETEMYKKAEAVFKKNGIVVFTGPPGCGKTMAAIHLIQKELHDWTFRKLHSLEEFAYIDEDTKSLVFIDNIFFHRTMDSNLGSWWDKLDRIFEKYFDSYDVEDKVNRLRIVMTTRSNVKENACTYMGKVTQF